MSEFDTNDSNLLTISEDGPQPIISCLVPTTTLTIGDIEINKATGKVTYPGDVDKAAKEFWDAVEKYILGKI